MPARGSMATRTWTKGPHAGLLAGALAVAALAGCGGAPHSHRAETPTAPTHDECSDAERALDAAREALRVCEEAAARAVGPRFAAAQEALAGLEARLDADAAVSAEEAQGAATAMWGALDEASAEEADEALLRERVEYGAEGLLRAREGDGARAALAEARASLEALREQAGRGPSPEEACAEERTRALNAEIVAQSHCAVVLDEGAPETGAAP